MPCAIENMGGLFASTHAAFEAGVKAGSRTMYLRGLRVLSEESVTHERAEAVAEFHAIENVIGKYVQRAIEPYMKGATQG